MPDQYAQAKEALNHQGFLVAGVLETLKPEEWYKPTRLEGWNVLTLVTHLQGVGAGLVEFSGKIVQHPPTQDRVSYWHFSGSEVADFIDHAAQQTAAKLTPKSAKAGFEASLQEGLAVLNRLEATTVVRLLFGSISLGELVVARIVELVIHSLDLFEALDRPVQLDPVAQRLTVTVLDALLDKPRPAALADDIDFIEAAGNRKPYPGLVIGAFERSN